MNVTASQIRQDLNCFGGFGQQGYGYNVKYLYGKISDLLGVSSGFSAVIIGAGNLGRALAATHMFERRGVSRLAMFDNDPRIVGSRIYDIDVYHIDTLADFCKKESADRIGVLVQDSLPKIWSVVSQSFSMVWGLVAVFMFMVYVLFILKDYELLERGWVSLIPEKYRERVVRLTEDVEDSMSNYFRGQSLVALCVGILFSIGFVIIDFPLAIGFGLFVGLLNIVPYLQTVALVPTVFLALVKAANTGGNFWWILVAAGIVFLVVQVIQETILIPRIMNKVTGLNPAVILLSLSIWGSLLGLVGMIIALPATSLLLSYYRRFLRKQEQEEKGVPAENP